MLKNRRKGNLYLVVSNPPPPPDDEPPNDDTELNKKIVAEYLESLPAKEQGIVVRFAEEMVRLNQLGVEWE